MTDKPKDNKIEKLFQEPFKPQWLLATEARELKSLDDYATVVVDYNYRVAAYEKPRLIARKHKR